LDAINPVLIHAQFGLSGVLALPLARSRKIPLLVHFRGADATITPESSRYASFNHWLYFRRRQILQQEATCFLTVSKFIKQKLVEQGYPSEKIIPHYHGVDLSQFTPNFDRPREPIILFVGRLTEKKGCQYLIQAVAKIQINYPAVKLVLIGEGMLRPQLEALAENSLCNYQFLGLQSSEVVQDWMNRASILASPSVTASDGDSEGLPNVVLEAQAMGLPVVSTYHAGIPEAVRHGETGFLTPERDVEALAQYSLKLLNHPELWQRFSHAGRDNMIINFDRIKQTQVLEKLYQDILDN
jgi:glycosyltransferase involved in cell wall biosynthesis